MSNNVEYTAEKKKEWILKNWKFLNGNTLAEALKKYWSKEILDRSQKPLDLYTEAVKIFK